MQKVYTTTSSPATWNLSATYARKQMFGISDDIVRKEQLKGETNLQEIDLNDASTKNPGNSFDEANSSSFQAHGPDQVLSEETISVSSTALPALSSTDVNASFSGASLAKLWMASLEDNSGSHDNSLESFVKSPSSEDFSIARKRATALGNSFNVGYEHSKLCTGAVCLDRNYLFATESSEKYTVTEPESFLKILYPTTLQPISKGTEIHELYNSGTDVLQENFYSGKTIIRASNKFSADTSRMNLHSSILIPTLRNSSSSNTLSRTPKARDQQSSHRNPPKSFSKNNSQSQHCIHKHHPSRTSRAASGRHSGPTPHRHRKRGAVYSSVVVHDSRLGPGMGGSAVESFDSSGLQRFATEPAPQTAVLGSTVVLPCRVMNKVGHLQWTKDGFGLGNERRLYGFARYSMIGSDDEGDFSLRIQPVQLEDDGFFQCQVSASDGVPGIRSEEVQLTVYVPPDPPLVEPAELQTTTGLDATLKCTSRGGRPPPEIQWIDDRHPREPLGLGAVTSMELMDDNKRSVVTSTLTFVPRRTHDNSTITCITSHQALTSPISRSARIRVQFAPEVHVSAHPPRLVEGDDAHFVCQAEANPPQLTYKWFHNSAELENQTAQTLTLPRISRNMHKDTVACEVSNKVGTSKKTLGVQVRYGPVFRSLPVDAAAEPGQEVMLRCSVDANPHPSIVWLQEGDNKIIGTGSELRVSVSPLTAGPYRCVVGVRERDLQFPELVGRMKVLLKGPPTIVSDTDQMGRPGATVNLECNTVSVPSPIKVTWTYKGKPIDLEESRYEVIEEQRNEGLRTILVIRDADETDFGDYNCSVVNEYGIARKLIRLNEEKRIPLLLVLGCSGAVVVSVGIVALCVLCNKRVRFEKGNAPQYNVNL
ncbi:Immunoglobulin-like domain [Trinorchestia longiramus]|nr:Immunoglobulin-like domain [Trinorchestia longiramus]